MIRGLSFKIPNAHYRFFVEILKNFDIKKYYWNIVEEDDQVFKDNGDFLFKDSLYSGEKFEEIINNNGENYYVVFANIRAFIRKADDMIMNYIDFLKSECKIAIICCDSEFVDIYCKDKNDVEIFKLSAQSNNYENIQYITDESDKRTNFRAI